MNRLINVPYIIQDSKYTFIKDKDASCGKCCFNVEDCGNFVTSCENGYYVESFEENNN